MTSHPDEFSRGGRPTGPHEPVPPGASDALASGSDLWFRTLLAPWMQAAWEADAQGRMTDDSPGWRSGPGQPLERWPSEGWPGAVHPDERDEARRRWGEAVARGTPFEAQVRLRHGDGWRWTSVRATPVRGADGAVERWLGLALDIADRDGSGPERRADEERHAFLLALGDALRPLASAELIGAEATRRLGQRLGARCALHVLAGPDGDPLAASAVHEDGVHPARWALEDLAAPLARELRAGRVVVAADVTRPAGDGPGERVALAGVESGAVVLVPLVTSGRLVAVLAAHAPAPRAWTAAEVRLIEQTAERTWAEVERARARMTLRTSEQRLIVALMAARMGTWTLHVASGVHTRDAPLNRLLGLPSADSSQPFAEFLSHLHPDDRADVAAAFDASIHQGVRLNVEFRVVWPDGTTRWLRDQGDVFEASSGAYLAGACVDVTERKEAEEAVRESEERLRLIVRSATDYAIYTLTPDRIVTSWSPGAAVTFGYSPAEIIGRSGDLVFTPEDRAAGAPEHEVDKARREGRAEDERWHLRKDGSRFYASGVVTPLGPRGTRGFVKVARDLTERKRMEDALREAHDRLEEKVIERTFELQAEVEEHVRTEAARTALQRQLATVQEDERRRIARDLHDQTGQLLAGLVLAIKAVGQAGPLPAAATERLAEVQRVADALGRQVHTLAVQLRPTALDDIGLRAALGQLTSQWTTQSGVAIDLQTVGVEQGRLPEEVETVIYRVVQEALTNVAKHAQATQVSVIISRQGDHVSAIVEDNGRGFEPSAVSPGRLGLVGMRERVMQVGGQLEIESHPGHGTTLLVRLPLAPTPLPPPVRLRSP